MKYIIEEKNDKILSFLLDDAGHAVEIHADSFADGPVLGDICIGQVQKVSEEIHAVFVEIVPGMTGYLPMEEIADPIYTSKGPSPDIQQGDELLVQICREAFGDKGVSLTTKLELSGRLVILTAGGFGLGVSHKIPPKERQAIKERIASSAEFGRLQEHAGSCGIVLRTNARYASDKEILREISLLESELVQIRLTAPYRPVHSILRKMPPRWLRRLDGLSEKTTEAIITDSPKLYKAIQNSSFAADKDKGSSKKPAAGLKRDTLTESSGRDEGGAKEAPICLRFYEDKLLPLDKLFSLERELDRALKKRVNMKSGADLVIETTEALHVIDVNSGRTKAGRKNKEELTLKVNLEAATECARQIRLRNLSGIILIDFINMENEENLMKVQEALKAAVSQDPVHTQAVGFTRLGLMEMTRKKVELPLSEQTADLYRTDLKKMDTNMNDGNKTGADKSELNESDEEKEKQNI